MPTSPSPTKPLLALAAGAALAVLGGCALSTSDPDVERGRVLFQEQCGTCHILTEANTAGTQGPDLDAAFARARHDGMDSDTIEGVVASQIDNPRPVVPDEPAVSMPADLVTGQDRDDVAAYVASVAGVPGIKPPPFTPPSFFADSCGSCHVLEQAGTTGALGPNLDQVLPGQSAQQISESIVNPGAQITQGFPNAMPQDVAAALSQEQVQALVDYLMRSTGGGGGGGSGGGGSGGG